MSSSAARYRLEIASMRAERMCCARACFCFRTDAAAVTKLAASRATFASRLALLRARSSGHRRTHLHSPSVIINTSTDDADAAAARALLSDTPVASSRDMSTLLLQHMNGHSSGKTYIRQRNALLHSFHRLVGVTAFSVIDPAGDGSAALTRELLGIRIECFTNKQFGPPHYIILARTHKTGEYELYKHTIPLYIPVRELSAKYLARDDLPGFIRAVRRLIMLDVHKRAWLSCLPGLRNIEADDSCELVKLEFDLTSSDLPPKSAVGDNADLEGALDKNKLFICMRCDATKIKSAVVTKTVARRGDESLALQRDKLLERRVLGRIDQLHSRLAGLIAL
ncbi:uncharacterized protein V1518DRAFT_413683 [Limtongia smithiae]|uniref:uncharacterized protein n=1 Tax=Limtongia smithiae TaxID=1125753 RepID=UPI0034CF652D